MTNFEVVYLYGPDGQMKLPSKVYAVDPRDNTFLIVDGWGKFHWADINKCVERTAWEFENGRLDFGDVDVGGVVMDETSEDIPEGYTRESWLDYCKEHQRETLVKLAEDIADALKEHKSRHCV